MLKNILYCLSLILFIVAGYYLYQWYQAEPENKEPLPALISLVSTAILTIIAWRMESNQKSTKQKIVAGKNSKVYQAGNDIKINKND